jgi:ketosteroid isomerase-like protein
MDTRAVFEHHATALGNGALEEVLQDYTDTSVLLTPDGTFRGRAALRDYFGAAVAGPFKPGTYDFTMDVVRIEGEVAYCVWHARCEGAEIVLGTDTFVVRDGKIAIQTYAARIEPR